MIIVIIELYWHKKLENSCKKPNKATARMGKPTYICWQGKPKIIRN